MKKKYLLLLIIFATIFGSCSKDKIIDTPDMVGISKVTYYPTFGVTGGQNISIVVGSTFTDPGVKASAGGADVPVTTTGTVDASTVGFYTLNYTATNKDGYSASTSRNVFVIPSAEVAGVDLSGTYMTTGGTPNANITKIAPGVYFTDNCWGNGSAAIISAYFICTDGTAPFIPLQNGPAGHIETTGPGTYVGGLITWEVDRLDFPGGALIKVKTWQKI